jgi:hypothetical protein
MRVAKFTVHVLVLTEFLDYINKKGLKSTIVSKKADVYNIEIAYTKEQAHIIDEMEELVDVLVVLTLVSLSALSYLAAAVQKRQPKKPAPLKTTGKKHCFFKDFVAQNVKK